MGYVRIDGFVSECLGQVSCSSSRGTKKKARSRRVPRRSLRTSPRTSLRTSLRTLGGSRDPRTSPRRRARPRKKSSEQKSRSEEKSSEDKSRSQEKSSNDAASERREEAARAQKKAEDQAMWGPFGPVKAFSIAGLEVARQAGFLKNGAWAEEKVRCPCCWLLKPRSTMHKCT